jgi:hypothetical protein
MNTDLVIGILLLVLFVNNMRSNWRISALEYRLLLTTEIIGLKEEGVNSPTAKAARDRINSHYKIHHILNEMS